jgi:disulfide bond formation protein DsbB
MSERLFLFFVGVFILTALYIEIDLMIYILCLWLLFEAITDVRLTTLSQKLVHKTIPSGLADMSLKSCGFSPGSWDLPF